MVPWARLVGNNLEQQPCAYDEHKLWFATSVCLLFAALLRIRREQVCCFFHFFTFYLCMYVDSQSVQNANLVRMYYLVYFKAWWCNLIVCQFLKKIKTNKTNRNCLNLLNFCKQIYGYKLLTHIKLRHFPKTYACVWVHNRTYIKTARMYVHMYVFSKW